MPETSAMGGPPGKDKNREKTLAEDRQTKNILWVEVHSNYIHLTNGIVYNITVTEDSCIVTEKRFIYVYRLVLDAKPDRGMI